jgi:HEAT repeat protein/type 1 glutamine amidotransferase
MNTTATQRIRTKRPIKNRNADAFGRTSGNSNPGIRPVLSLCFLLSIFFSPVIGTAAQSSTQPIRTLIVTGQNYHNWKLSSAALKQMLEDTGLFRVDIAVSPPAKANMRSFHPDFSSYSLVVLDYSGDPWPSSTRKAFVTYVKNGGGVVVYHSANNSFPDWPEYNEIIGLAGWGERNEKAGPYVFWKNGRIVRDTGPGVCGQHGPPHEFLVFNRDTVHPITAGLPERWMHTKDELYGLLRGPAKNLHILATATSAPEQTGTGRHEPVLFTVQYGAGRVFHTVLGHVDSETPPALECVGFITTFRRGAEWAATGRVTQEVPPDFPAANMNIPAPADVRRWPGFRPPSLEAILKDLESFEYSKSEDILYRLREYVLANRNSEEARADTEERMLGFLVISQNLDAKMAVCRNLRLIGSEKSVRLLAQMLTDEKTADIARYALEKIPGPAADRALLDALAKTQGETRIGLVSTLGQRKSGVAVGALAALLSDQEPALASAAANALGKIGSGDAAAVLSEALDKAGGDLKVEVAFALLNCADALSAAKDSGAAMKSYDRILATQLQAFPLVLRQAAMRGKISAAGKDDGARLILDVLSLGPAEMHEPAIGMIGQFFSESAVGTVCGLLTKLPEGSQVQLLSVLSAYPSWAVLSALLDAAKSAQPSVRVAALQALGNTGDVSTVNFLAGRAASARGKEQEAARLSLWTLAGKEIDEAVLFGLVSATSEAARNEFIRAVGERQIHAGKAHLISQAASGADQNKQEAVRALRGMIRPEDIPALLNLLLGMEDETAQEEMQSTIAAAALKIGDPTARSSLVEEMLEPGTGSKQQRVEDPTKRCLLYRTLGKIGDDSSLPPLRAALKDGREDIRDAAVRALIEWPNTTPQDEVLSIAKSSGSLVHRVLALRGFVRLVGLNKYQAPESAVCSLQAALDLAARPEEKILVLGVLPDFSCPEALALAESLLSAEGVQEEAEIAVARIKEKLKNKPS